jgi:NAD(P)-dependent dehydrogenase (short-subunit alcohol dehydrogenase family)
MSTMRSADVAEVAIVTGGASGIGAATAEQLLQRNVAVVVIDLPGAVAGREDESRRAWMGGDVRDESTWDAALKVARSKFSLSPSILICNAGVVRTGKIIDVPIEDWRMLFDVMVIGAVLGMRACIPAMLERGRGSIVTVGSVDSFMAEQETGPYCAAKAALMQLTRCTAMDYARQGIRANCVCPGVTDTPFFRRGLATLPNPENRKREREERNPLGRLLEPMEVANAISFLCSDAASGITGSVVTVDAGLSAGFEYLVGEREQRA